MHVVPLYISDVVNLWHEFYLRYELYFSFQVELEKRRESNVEDYWLIQYQRLLDNKPVSLLEKECDQEVVSLLKEANADDYAALFARHCITWKMLKNMTADELKEVSEL